MFRSICFLSLLFILLPFGSINAQKWNAELYSGTSLTFGRKMSKTTPTEQYVINDDNQVFLSTTENESWIYRGKLPKKIVQKQFRKLKAIRFDFLNINQPGEQSYFIIYKSEKGKYRNMWSGTAATSIPQNLSNFYDDLWNLAKEVN